MRALLNLTCRWVFNLFSKPKRSRKRSRLKLKYKDDVPELLEDDLLYVVGENGEYWMICFKCPCRCGELIHLNLLKEASPYWKFLVKNGRLSISPSIWKTTGCKSHFKIYNNKVKWFSGLFIRIRHPLLK